MPKFLNFFKKEDSCTLLSPIEGEQVEKYTHFRALLRNNYVALNVIADMEQAYYGGRPITLQWLKIKCHELFDAVGNIISSFESLSGKKAESLSKARDAIAAAIVYELRSYLKLPSSDIIIPFEKITNADMKRMTGSKAGNLALIKNALEIPVPDGFAITAYAVKLFMDSNNLTDFVSRSLEVSEGELEHISRQIMGLIMQATVPSEIEEELMKAYENLEKNNGAGVHVAVRSSAIGEDTEASFAGQYTTELNVTRENILQAYKTVLASKYSERAITYRRQYGLDDIETPMCAACIVMLDPKASGVLYTVNPEDPFSETVKINSVSGLGEYLVDGSASPDLFIVSKEADIISEQCLGNKEFRMINLKDGGIELETIPKAEQSLPSIDSSIIFKLRDYALILEEYFGCPQDVEWAVDKNGGLFILQSRPLHVTRPVTLDENIEINETDNPILISGGKTASPGVAIGTVLVADTETPLSDIHPGTILVARTASPSYAKAINNIRGIITDMGSTTSHLSSVAREFGVPALVDTQNATMFLKTDDIITLHADTGKVYKGVVEQMEQLVKPVKKPIFDSPVFQRARRILDYISPLNLTDNTSPSFSAEECKSFHDIIRFTHEQSMKHMFNFGERSGIKGSAVTLTANIPMFFKLVDIGGGLKFGLSKCDTITPDHVESLPFKAVWKGFTHPGISWSGGIGVSAGDFMSLMISGGMSGETPGGTSYIIVAEDYMNMSARFGYHFATIDTLCSEDANHNYITLQFSGGIGTYHRRSLRIIFLGNVLKRLGFEVSLNGDLLQASLTRFDKAATVQSLDQMARLLACSRLLDMAISSQDEVSSMTDAFFREEYKFLEKKTENDPKDLYVHTGFWSSISENGKAICVQDGAQWTNPLSSGFSRLMGKAIGSSYQDFLDNIEAYHYFPFAVAKNSEITDGSAEVLVKAVLGSIDRAGGLAFAIKDVCNYFVLRINALEDNVVLFEFDKCKRFQRKVSKIEIKSNEWYHLKVEISGNFIKGFVNNELLIEYEVLKPLQGYIGLWTKADSVTHFSNMNIQSDKIIKSIEF